MRRAICGGKQYWRPHLAGGQTGTDLAVLCKPEATPGPDPAGRAAVSKPAVLYKPFPRIAT